MWWQGITMQASSIYDADNLLKVLKEFAEKKSWHLKYAKFNWRVHQSLLAHSLSVSSLSYSLLDYLGELQCVKVTDKLRMQVLLTGFLHDAGKESESFQGAVEDFLAGRGA
jgi:HD superfamily phosphodiesterase